MTAFGEQVVALLDHLGAEQAVIGGTSLGANVSLEVADIAPERVRGLILEMPVLDDVDTAVSFSPDGRQFVFMRGAGSQTQIVVANADGSAQRIVTTRKPPLRFWYAAPAWSTVVTRAPDAAM